MTTAKIIVSPKGRQSYPVILSADAKLSAIIPYILNKQVLVVSNTTVSDLYLKELEDTIKEKCFKYKSCILADGEIYKNSKSLDTIFFHLLELNYTKECILLALGGGVIGDITGFAAATYQRGSNIIHIPTTLLSQIDSSIGGKTAINHILGKNMIGAFFQPNLVITSIHFLKTLPNCEFFAGMAEIIKYGCIADKDFFAWIECNIQSIKTYDQDILTYMISKSCELKAQIISLDEKEKSGIRTLLNFGHTFGHAIEYCQNYQGLKHGEVVAIGMVMAAKLSLYKKLIHKSVVTRIILLLNAFSLPTSLPKKLNKKKLMAAILRDKKNTIDGINFVLLDNIGHARVELISENYLSVFLEKYFY